MLSPDYRGILARGHIDRGGAGIETQGLLHGSLTVFPRPLTSLFSMPAFSASSKELSTCAPLSRGSAFTI